MELQISANADDFWRAGRQWYRKPTPVNPDDFTDDQWELLEADPAITIEPYVEPQPEDPAPPEDPAAALEQLRVSLEDSRAHVNDLVADKERLVAENGALQAELEALRQQVARGGQTAPEGAPAGAADAPAGPHYPTREERIRGAVATSLEADGPEHRTRTGRPVLARVREISRIDDVSAAERDAAREATQAAAD